MPIPKEAFDAGSFNSNLSELFINNPDKAYSLKELIEKFGTGVAIELPMLHIKGIIEVKKIEGDLYFTLAQKRS